jgi:hypothetical protein
MPKLNDTHLPERLKEAIKQLEEGKEVEAKKNKTLLNAKQQQALVDAWDKQQELRKQHKPPKTEEEKKKIGWKDKREVRLDIYKQAHKELMDNIFDIHLRQLEREEAKANRVYLKGYFSAKDGQDPDSVGKIALARAGFMVARHPKMSKRDREIMELEDGLRKRFEAEMTDEEREEREWLKEIEKAEEEGRKNRFK